MILNLACFKAFHPSTSVLGYCPPPAAQARHTGRRKITFFLLFHTIAALKLYFYHNYTYRFLFQFSIFPFCLVHFQVFFCCMSSMIVVQFFFQFSFFFLDYETCKYKFSNTFDWEMLQNAVPRLNLYSNPSPVRAGNSFYMVRWPNRIQKLSSPAGRCDLHVDPEVLLQLMIVAEIHSPRTSSLRSVG